jgi:hypothetical protein
VYGTSWLDLFRITADERYRDAVLLLAERLAAKERPHDNFPKWGTKIG